MIKEELYHKSVQILFDAYFNDTLVHGDCYACAVGNLVSANCGYSIVKKGMFIEWIDVLYPAHNGWGTVFLTHGFIREQQINEDNYKGTAKEQIDATGYTWQELAKIEKSFELSETGESEEDFIFNGLVAVLNTLRDIHQVTDEDLIQGNNKRFKDQYNKRTEKVLRFS